MMTSLMRPGRFIDHPVSLLFSAAGKRLLAVSIGLLLLQNAHAALYMLEPFDYLAGPLTNAPPWSSNGTAVETFPTMLIVPGDLAYPPLNQPTTVNSGSLQWSSNAKGERAIPGGPYGDPVNGGAVYCSFMFCKASTNFSVANLPIVGMCVDNTTTLNSATLNGVVLNITAVAGGNYQLGVKLGGGVNSAVYPPSGQIYTAGDTNTATFGQTNFVVMKYTFVPGAANDTVALWVNPTSSSFGGSEPAPTPNDVAATNATGFNADASTGLGFFQIRGGSGTTAGILLMDNVRIGSTWADVTPTCITAGISTNPAPQAVSPGQMATFTIGATGANPTYQWQTNNGGGWTNIVGATNVSYTTAPEVLANNGLQFRCIVSVACDSSSVTSAAATLTVENCVSAATTNPGDQTVNAGSTATFTITPTGTHPTFQWQLNNGGGFANINGATNASYTTPPESVTNSGFQFRCTVSVACDNSTATSAAATLTVVCNTAQVSTLQNQTVVAGHPATFSVTSSSSNPTFQWATNNGTGFINIPGATNSSYTTGPEVVGDYGLVFQCTVSVACDNSTASTAATLIVNCFTATISTDIANTSVALGAGQTTTFAINAGNTSLPTYQWQTNNGGGFINIPGATNASYTTPPLLLANNGLKYQCIVTAPCDGSMATSLTATVSVYSDNAEFLSVASGNVGNPTTWEQSFDGGSTFNNPALYPPADINSTNTVVQSGFTVAAAANTPLNHVVVQSGGQLSVNTNITITLTTNIGGTALDISGVMDVTGAVVINSGAQAMVESGGIWKTEQGGSSAGTGTLTFKSGAVYQHNYTTTAGTIPTATWNTGSTCEVIGITTGTTTLAGVAQGFYNFIWNCPGQSSALPWGGSVPTNHGDFTFISTGTGEVRISNNNSPAMNLSGNFNLQGGHLTFASGTGKPSVNLSGNAVLTGGTLSNSTGSAGATVNFVKAGTQSFTNSGTTILGPINWVVQSSSILQCSGVLSSNLILASGGQIRLTTNTPLFHVSGNLTNNNNTVVVDLGGATLGNGTYPLMTYQGRLSGFFKSTPTLLNGSVTGVAFISTATTNQVNLMVAPPSQPAIASVSLTGTALNITATNGIPGISYGLLASTNAALPLSQWTPIIKNGLFDGSGNLNLSLQLSNTLSASASQQFFRIQMPSP
jgi:hypothetical protein